MPETPVQVTITLSAPKLKLTDEGLQDAVQNLQLELQEVQGVTDAQLIPVEQAPPNSKGIGGGLLGEIRAWVSMKHLKTLVNYLGNHLFGKTVKIKIEEDGQKLKLEFELNRPEDIDIVMPQVERIIKRERNE